jgi:hypothetical protein
MAKKYKRQGGEKFLALYRHTYRSEAWKALKPNDRALYFVVLQRYDGFNNGRIALSQREAAKDMNVANLRTVAACFAELEEKGFIRRTVASGFNRKDRTASLYLLTEYKDDRTGAPPTKDYMNWRPPEKTTDGNFTHHRWQKYTCPPENKRKSASTDGKNAPVKPVTVQSTDGKNTHLIESTIGLVPNGDAHTAHPASADPIPNGDANTASSPNRQRRKADKPP